MVSKWTVISGKSKDRTRTTSRLLGNWCPKYRDLEPAGKQEPGAVKDSKHGPGI